MSENCDDDEEHELYSCEDVIEDEDECIYPDDEEDDAYFEDDEDDIPAPVCFQSPPKPTEQTDDLSPIGDQVANKKSRVGTTDKIIISDIDGIQNHYYNNLIAQVGKLLCISSDEALALLIYFKWNKEKLQEAYFGDAIGLRKIIGINLYRPYNSSTATSNTLSSKAVKCDANNLILCEVCYDEVPSSNIVALGCEHPFCSDCFRTYLETQVGNGPPGCLTTKCPHYKCTQVVPHSYFRGLLSNAGENSARLLEKQEAYCLRNYIENSRSMNFCRAAHCELIAVATSAAHVDEVVKCPCGHRYCFKCGEEPHQPCNCSQLSTWNDKCSNESETTNWIMANTKKCPKCSVRIEKNQGCNHMTCKHCSHHFCWLCFADWNKHGYNYKCNALEMSSGEAAMNAKRDLDRYIHYYKRWNDHRLSLTFAQKQVTKLHDQLLELSIQQILTTEQVRKIAIQSSMAKQQLLRAAELIVECRRVLQHTYVLGYFVDDHSAEKQLFEFSQSMLEHHTEMLHEVTELYVGENPPDMDSMKVINLTMVTEKFLNSLMDCMRGGILLMRCFDA